MFCVYMYTFKIASTIKWTTCCVSPVILNKMYFFCMQCSIREVCPHQFGCIFGEILQKLHFTRLQYRTKWTQAEPQYCNIEISHKVHTISQYSNIAILKYWNIAISQYCNIPQSGHKHKVHCRSRNVCCLDKYWSPPPPHVWYSLPMGSGSGQEGKLNEL